MKDAYEVLAIRYATRETRASEVYLNFHTYGAKDHELVMDYFVWVVRNQDVIVVVDTGFKPEVGERRGRTMTCPVQTGLARAGVDLDSVDAVVLTHAHYDHIGNVDLFANAEVLMSGAELDFWRSDVASRFQFAMAVEQADIDYLGHIEEAGRLKRIAASTEVAPGVTVVEVGGHTPGQLVVLVDGENGPVLLTSDAVHYYDEVELDRPFLIVSDLGDMYRGFDYIRHWAERTGGPVVAGHDPIVLDRFSPLDPSDPGFGVRI